jgi:2'-5' RNA ligase superfamily
VKAVDSRRVDFALIPESPLFTAVIDASQAITDEFCYNANVIDDTMFPPHLSLHICTVPHDTLSQVVDSLKALATADLPDLVPIGVERADGGYVMLNIEPTAELMALHEAILRIAVEARENLGQDKYSSLYIREHFTPHMSLAKVDYRDQAEAVKIGRETLGELGTVPARTLDLCDIGERSERWEILASLPE